MATLMLSQGVPMIRGGDELSQSQQGNNNAYCQDNEISWLDWSLTGDQERFLEFTRRMIRLRLSQPVLHRRRFFQGRSIRGAGIKDISWFDPKGIEMTDEAWSAPSVKSLGVRLAGDAIDERTERGERVSGHTLLLLLNADENPISFALPTLPTDCHWEEAADSANGRRVPAMLRGGEQYHVDGRSSAVFVLRREKRRRQRDLTTSVARRPQEAQPAEAGAAAPTRTSNARVVPAR
jgi:isoamylase